MIVWGWCFESLWRNQWHGIDINHVVGTKYIAAGEADSITVCESDDTNDATLLLGFGDDRELHLRRGEQSDDICVSVEAGSLFGPANQA